MGENSTFVLGTFIYSEDTRSMFSGFRSVWISRNSCISVTEKGKKDGEHCPFGAIKSEAAATKLANN
jgi:hypothetical protein